MSLNVMVVRGIKLFRHHHDYSAEELYNLPNNGKCERGMK
jgi:hypothetical protein